MQRGDGHSSPPAVGGAAIDGIFDHMTCGSLLFLGPRHFVSRNHMINAITYHYISIHITYAMQRPRFFGLHNTAASPSPRADPLSPSITKLKSMKKYVYGLHIPFM